MTVTEDGNDATKNPLLLDTNNNTVNAADKKFEIEFSDDKEPKDK